jgi:hypothetical protein
MQQKNKESLFPEMQCSKCGIKTGDVHPIYGNVEELEWVTNKQNQSVLLCQACALKSDSRSARNTIKPGLFKRIKQFFLPKKRFF